jgi:hypothetical protein
MGTGRIRGRTRGKQAQCLSGLPADSRKTTLRLDPRGLFFIGDPGLINGIVP